MENQLAKLEQIIITRRKEMSVDSLKYQGELMESLIILEKIQELKADKTTFQDRVKPWLQECFTETVLSDKVERNYRFLEEALELVQSIGFTKEQSLKMIDHVYDRPAGDPYQEVGGVMVTLAALCIANGLNMHNNGETELYRVWQNIDKIKAKQLAKEQQGITSKTT